MNLIRISSSCIVAALLVLSIAIALKKAAALQQASLHPPAPQMTGKANPNDN